MKLEQQEDGPPAVERVQRQSMSMGAVVAGVALPYEWEPEQLALTELIGQGLLLRVIEAFFQRLFVNFDTGDGRFWRMSEIWRE